MSTPTPDSDDLFPVTGDWPPTEPIEAVSPTVLFDSCAAVDVPVYSTTEIPDDDEETLYHTTHTSTVSALLDKGLEPGHAATIERVYATAETTTSEAATSDDTAPEVPPQVAAVRSAEAYLERVREDVAPYAPARRDCVALWPIQEIAATLVEEPEHLEVAPEADLEEMEQAPVSYVALMLDADAVAAATQRYVWADYTGVADIVQGLVTRARAAGQPVAAPATTAQQAAAESTAGDSDGVAPDESGWMLDQQPTGDVPDPEELVHTAAGYWMDVMVASTPDLPTQAGYQLPELLVPTAIPADAIRGVIVPPHVAAAHDDTAD